MNTGKRSRGNDLRQVLRDESERILTALPKNCEVIALERTGRPVDTLYISAQMQQWMLNGRDVALPVGGPDGLSQECIERADVLWSLSALTLAHPVARIVLVEQLYRAWSILENHPYHRGG